MAGAPHPPGSQPRTLADANRYRLLQPFAERMKADRPLRARYFVEYPHAALLLFRAGYLVQPGMRDLDVPAAFADADYHDIADFTPTDPEHIKLMRMFVFAARFYVAVMVILWYALALVLTAGYGPKTQLAGGAALLLLPATLYFTLNRFDIVPAEWHSAVPQLGARIVSVT